MTPAELRGALARGATEEIVAEFLRLTERVQQLTDCLIEAEIKEQAAKPTAYDLTRPVQTDFEEGGYSPPPVAHVKRPPAPPPPPKKKETGLALYVSPASPQDV